MKDDMMDDNMGKAQGPSRGRNFQDIPPQSRIMQNIVPDFRNLSSHPPGTKASVAQPRENRTKETSQKNNAADDYSFLFVDARFGKDWINETKSDVDPLLDLEYGKIKLVIAIPDTLKFKNFDQMIAEYAKKKKILRLSSEYLTNASKFIKSCKSYKKAFGNKDPMIITPWMRVGTNKNVQIHLSFGATEAKPPEDVDAIMDVTETGTTLKQNGLKIIDTVMKSSAHLIANKQSLKDKKKREKIFDIVTLMSGAVQGKKYLHLYLNIKENNLKKLLKELPSLKKPTVSPLSEKGWVGVNTVILKTDFHKLIPKLRKIAQGIVVHEPRQILQLEEIKRDEEN